MRNRSAREKLRREALSRRPRSAHERQGAAARETLSRRPRSAHEGQGAAAREAAQRWGIAVGVALVAGLFLAWAVVASYGPVRPRVECVMPLGTGTYVAYFGYTNTKTEVITIPLGDDNEVGPGTAAEGPPTLFPPGSSPAFPGAAFAVTFAASDKVRWTLGPRTVVATRDSAACPIPEEKPLPPPESVVLPKPIAVVKVEPPPEPPKVIDPPKAEPAKPEPPKTEPARPRIKDPSRPARAEVAGMVEPIPLMAEALSNGPTDVLVMVGETTLGEDMPLGSVGRAVPASPPGVGVPGPGQGTPPREVVRKSARPKTRPQGRWPDDAPPRAGSVAVRLSALVGVDGKVKSVKVIAGAGGAFDREARAVVLSVVFEPASEDGVPIESWVPWVVEFTPDE